MIILTAAEHALTYLQEDNSNSGLAMAAATRSPDAGHKMLVIQG